MQAIVQDVTLYQNTLLVITLFLKMLLRALAVCCSLAGVAPEEVLLHLEVLPPLVQSLSLPVSLLKPTPCS